jgi:hypothetical protein
MRIDQIEKRGSASQDREPSSKGYHQAGMLPTYVRSVIPDLVIGNCKRLFTGYSPDINLALAVACQTKALSQQ